MDKEGQSRRPSLLEKMHLTSHKSKAPVNSETASQHSESPLLGKLQPKPKKERKEHLSDSGPFIIEVDENGNSHCRENNNWPPGTHYEIPNRFNKDQGLGKFYTDRNITPGGDL